MNIHTYIVYIYSQWDETYPAVFIYVYAVLPFSSPFPASSSHYEPPKSFPGAEEATEHLDIQAADMSSTAVGTLMSPENGHTAGVTRDSATSTNATSSLGGTSSSLRTRTHHPNNSQEATDLPEPPLLTSSLSASGGPFPGKFVGLKAVCLGMDEISHPCSVFLQIWPSVIIGHMDVFVTGCTELAVRWVGRERVELSFWVEKWKTLMASLLMKLLSWEEHC